MISRKWLAGLILCFSVSGANAIPSTALYLSMDGSGSIDVGDFTDQINGYVTALNSVFAAHPSLFGDVAIGGNIFGADVIEFFPVTTIEDNLDLTALTAAIAALDPARGGVDTTATAIGQAVSDAADALLAFELFMEDDITLIIDVTTDGVNNVDPDPGTVANQLVNIDMSIDAVNCLGLPSFGGGSGDCSWVGSAGTDFGSVSFENLADALEDKIVTEVIGVPEPGMLALMGIGLALVGFVGSVHRRKAVPQTLNAMPA